MINKNNAFVQKLMGLKPYVREACMNVKPRKVTLDEFAEALLNLEVAENQFRFGCVEDVDTNALKLTIAEIELSKLVVAHKRYTVGEIIE